MASLRAVLVVLGLATIVWSGCGAKDPHGRLPIAGTVEFQGKPLDRGSIEFAPETGGGALSGTMIKDGGFRLEARHGLPAGTYLVRISSPDVSAMGPAPEVPGEHKQEAQERIPPEYNAKSTLTINVTEDGDNEFDLRIP